MRLRALDTQAASPLVGVLLVVAVVLMLGSTVSLFVLQVGDQLSDPAPNAAFRVESSNFGDGVAKNDTVRITHVGGDTLERGRLEVVVGDDTVYNATADSESTNPSFQVPGLIVEVDDGDFNDLNKPCRVDEERVSPNGTCGGPPGDGDGSDSGVVLQWANNVSAGQTIVIQERNADEAYDVMDAGEEVKIVYSGTDFSAIIAREVVGPQAASGG